jgi:hypothetical protein
MMPTSAMENPAASTAEVSVDWQGNVHMPHVRREQLETEDGFRSSRQAARKAKKVHHAAVLMSENTPGDPVQQQIDQVQAEHQAEVQHDVEAISDGAPVTNPRNIDEARTEINKLDAVVQTVEAKAGLPAASIATEPESTNTKPSTVEREGTALTIALISLVVLIASCSAAWSVYVIRKMHANGRKPAAALLADEDVDESEHPGEEADDEPGEDGEDFPGVQYGEDVPQIQYGEDVPGVQYEQDFPRAQYGEDVSSNAVSF